MPSDGCACSCDQFQTNAIPTGTVKIPDSCLRSRGISMESGMVANVSHLVGAQRPEPSANARICRSHNGFASGTLQVSIRGVSCFICVVSKDLRTHTISIFLICPQGNLSFGNTCKNKFCMCQSDFLPLSQVVHLLCRTRMASSI